MPVGGVYPVVGIFGPTLQGEGHFVGYPAVFVRLAGCSVTGCYIRDMCDEAPWRATARLDAKEIAAEAWRRSPGGIVVITGGEPTDHDLPPLIASLREYGFRVHLETSGIRSLVGWPIEWLTVSPKTTDYRQRSGHTLKIVVRPGWTWREVVALDEGTTFFHRYLQPLTDPATGVPINMAEVIAMLIGPRNCMSSRWALSAQAHRYWGVP